MKLKARYDYSGRTYTIAEAVTRELSDLDPGGELENMHRQIDNISETLGRLVQELHKSAAISDGALHELIGYGYEEAPESKA